MWAMLLGLLSRYRHSVARLWRSGPFPSDGDDQPDDSGSAVRVPLRRGPSGRSSAIALTEPEEATGEINAVGKVRHRTGNSRPN
ncbi:MAG: hypothetical protein V7647_382 [Acidobacteriota bacterium]|jgi:hypothetical protein